ncbi:glycoside hydrolase family 5 protein [Lasiosphaeria miniovina]|uniref:Glycoside hydrolase family 5 protein n=1 Tax=Lasiosphaeria miniovina TaxID=1954250 RepID=A0AA40DSA4_9PEZI|nr:glycoside hydrolase family 5 protein [Lasiosphaeria miniovina]KAK0713660.1 glycoside hydrolase family 5 protein [Lasiosphaeria miniovina]
MASRPLSSLWLVSTTSGTAWPNGPFRTSGRWIIDASGADVTYAGVSWPAHGETMLPEGLQYQSVAAIVAKIKSLDMNAIRLTYAIEMIDQIYASATDDSHPQDVSIETALVNALGRENGTAVLASVLKNNPSFSKTTKRLQVFDAVASECAKQEIYTQGLEYMAQHAKAWPNLVSMSLRNELRQPLLNLTLYSQSYNWATWYDHMREGAAAIHAAHPDTLVFLSGLDSDTTLDAVVQGLPLTSSASSKTPAKVFDAAADFASGLADKLVLELHTYINPATCSAFEARLAAAGFQTLNGTAKNTMPLLLTEFGYTQDAATWRDSVYASCLLRFLPAKKAGWMIWVLAGSYYVREGQHDYDEGWGLLSHDWSAWRSPRHVEGGLVPLVQATLEGVRAGKKAG